MKRGNKVVAALAALGLSCSAAMAAELDLDGYIALSIERLELSKQSWAATGQPPARAAMDAVFARYGVSERDYMAYTSANREAIEAFLVRHPNARQRIDDLSGQIEQAIQDQPTQ